MNLVIIGTGYVGLTAGIGFAKLGHKVACVDVDATKIAKLDLGEATFFEPGLQEALTELQDRGGIVFTTDLASVLPAAEIVLIAVGTPARPTGEADLSYVMASADEIGRLLDHEALIVMKSTVPVGTTRLVLDRIRERMALSGRGDLADLVTIASVPEFLREGTALKDFFAPDRIVIGSQDSVAVAQLQRLHEGIKSQIVVMSLESAELSKYAANAFLATKISLINEMANISERVGADVRDVARVVGLDPRISPHFLNAGIGYGGSCFPKDVAALHQLSGSSGYEFKLLSAVIEVNNRQRELYVKKIEASLGGLKGRQIGVWGLAFKRGTDDVRESAAIDVVQRLFARGADIKVYDPRAMENAKRVLSDRVAYASTPIDAAMGAEALLVLTEWDEFRDVSFSTLKDVMLELRVFDARNLLADKGLEAMGFMYEGIGFSSKHAV